MGWATLAALLLLLFWARNEAAVYDGSARLVTGEVQLQRHDWPPVPVMRPTVGKRSAVTLNQWLDDARTKRKAVRVRLREWRAVRPAIDSLLVASLRSQRPLVKPVVVEADVWRAPQQWRTGKGQSGLTSATNLPVDLKSLLDLIERSLPGVVLSLGWRQDHEEEDIELHHWNVNYMTNEENKRAERRLSWRDILNVFEDTHSIQQTVVIHVSADVASHSIEQLLWLTAVVRKPRYVISVTSSNRTQKYGTDWKELVKLRRFNSQAPTHQQSIFFDDLTLEDERKLQRLEETTAGNAISPSIKWDWRQWRSVEFLVSQDDPSAIALSEVVGPAFIGWPSGFLLAEKQAKVLNDTTKDRRQIISGRAIFVKKRDFSTVVPVTNTGLSIRLLNSIDDIPSVEIRRGIHVFIGFDGHLFIENLDSSSSTDSTRPAKVIGSLNPSECYQFLVKESTMVVQLLALSIPCAGASRREDSLKTLLTLYTATSEKPRYALLQKSGDSVVDVVVSRLQITSGKPSTCCAKGLLLTMLTILLVYDI